jgi:hypothetical protein
MTRIERITINAKIAESGILLPDDFQFLAMSAILAAFLIRANPSHPW